MKSKIQPVKNANKLSWLRKLASSKNFIVITDTEGVVSIEMKDDLNSVIKYSSQIATLEHFRNSITQVIDEMNKNVDKALDQPKKRSARKPEKSGKKG